MGRRTPGSGNKPKTPTPVVVGTNTFPFAMVGGIHLMPAPAVSLPRGACLLLFVAERLLIGAPDTRVALH